LAVLGDPDDVADLLCSMVVDATAGRVGAPADVVLVGFGEAMHGLDGIVAVPDERAALHVLERHGAPGHAARGATVVFVGSRRDAAALRDLLAVATRCAAGHPEAGAGEGDSETDDPEDRPTRGMAVVVAGECVEARWRLDLRAGSLEEALVRQLGRATPPAAADPAAPPGAAPEHSVEICVLGPVRVNGTAEPFERRPKLTELVVYLALHPEGATSDAWATALWPDRRMPMSTLSNRLSETRLSLGYAPDGFAHLRKRGGRYHLGPYVSTDWDRFQQLAADPDPAGWRAALALVRGRPFEGLREVQWTLLEGVVPAIEAAVVELACRLAEHLLAARDPEGAEWAARRAMLSCPWDERLYRLVMRAADAAGNRAGVEAALRQLACVLELGEEPLSAVHPETAALYRSLTSRRAVL
jgi:DNA-binding SARP family transcriptional activator